MPLVKGICMSCGGQIEFGEDVKKGFCLHCGTAFIKEDVVNKFNIVNNIQIGNAVIQSGPTVENLVIRARRFQKEGDYHKAIEIANKALDLDPAHKEADKIANMRFKILDGKKLTIEQFEAAITKSLHTEYDSGWMIKHKRIDFNNIAGTTNTLSLDVFRELYNKYGAEYFLVGSQINFSEKTKAKSVTKRAWYNNKYFWGLLGLLIVANIIIWTIRLI